MLEDKLKKQKMQFESEMKKIEIKMSLRKRATSTTDVMGTMKFGRNNTMKFPDSFGVEDKKGGSPDIIRKKKLGQQRRAVSTRNVFSINPRKFNEGVMSRTNSLSPNKVSQNSDRRSSVKKRKASENSLTGESPRLELKDIEKIPEEIDSADEAASGFKELKEATQTVTVEELELADTSKTKLTPCQISKVIHKSVVSDASRGETPLKQIDLTDFGKKYI